MPFVENQGLGRPLDEAAQASYVLYEMRSAGDNIALANGSVDATFKRGYRRCGALANSDASDSNFAYFRLGRRLNRGFILIKES
jgi:hypothetical protein